MRHAERLDHVFDARDPRARHGEFAAPPFRRQEIIQFVVEAECCGEHGGLRLVGVSFHASPATTTVTMLDGEE